jgi:predicted dehydrogenase
VPAGLERVTPGEGVWKVILCGDEGTLIVDGGDEVSRQRADEEEPVPIEFPMPDQDPEGFDFIQRTSNRLIADFVQAIRQGDVNHTSIPHLATVVDGLRCQEIIAAARKSDEEMRWVSLADLAEGS